MLEDQKPERISLKSIIASILAVFNFQKGLPYTIKNLLLRPKVALENYLSSSERSKFYKPANFLFLMVTIASFLLLRVIGIDSPDQVAGSSIGDVTSGSSINFGNDVSPKFQEVVLFFNSLMGDYYHIFQLLKVPFFALATYWIFGRKKYNYAEHLVVNAYIIGMTTFIFIVATPALLINTRVFAFLTLLSLLYLFYAQMFFFEARSWRGLLQAIAAYLLSTILHFVVLILLVGIFYLLK